MADVPASLNSWSSTASSNSPTDATTIGAGLADNLQALQAVVRGYLAAKGSDVASSANPDVGAVQGLYHDVTGSNTITGLGSTATAGIWKILQFDASPPLVHSSLFQLLGEATIVPAAGDVGIFFCESTSRWRMVSYNRAAISPHASASATAAGVVELATDAETLTGTDTTRAVTPANLSSVLGLTLLASGTASGATLDIDLSGYTAYTHLKIVFSLLPASDGVNLNWNASIDGGSNFVAGTSYAYAVHAIYDDGTSNDYTANAGSGGALSAVTDIGNGATEGIKGNIDLYNFASTSLWKLLDGTTTWISDTATPRLVTAKVSGAYKGADDVTDIRFSFSSGNLASGTYSVYGWSA